MCCLLLRMELSSSSSFSTSLPTWNSSSYSFSFKLPISTTKSIATSESSSLFVGFSKHLRSIGHFHHHRRSSPSPVKRHKRPISIKVNCLLFSSLLFVSSLKFEFLFVCFYFTVRILVGFDWQFMVICYWLRRNHGVFIFHESYIYIYECMYMYMYMYMCAHV